MSFDYKLPLGKTKEDFGIKDATYHFAEFKSDVETALKNYFGAAAVSRSDKTLNVHENTSRVDADVTPVFEHRRYQANGEPLEGVALLPDRGGPWIPNWHEQHYDNGVTKNIDTSKVYKKVVRILKKLENKMVEEKPPVRPQLQRHHAANEHLFLSTNGKKLDAHFLGDRLRRYAKQAGIHKHSIPTPSAMPAPPTCSIATPTSATSKNC